MAKESNAPEKIQVLVETRSNTTGLNQTIALLKTFEEHVDRIVGKLGGLGGGVPRNKAIQSQIEELQKLKGLGLSPSELGKAFGIPDDLIKKRATEFRGEINAAKKKFSDYFAESLRSAKGANKPLEDISLASAPKAAEFLQPLLAARARAEKYVADLVGITSTIAHPTPHQVADQAINQPPPKVTITKVEPEVQRQAVAPQGPLPTPRDQQVTIPANIIPPKQVAKLSVVKKGTDTLPVKFSDALDQAAFLANQAADKAIRQALGEWADSKLNVAKDEFFEHGRKVNRAVQAAAKATKTKGPISIQSVPKVFTMPLEPVIESQKPRLETPSKPLASAAAYSFGQMFSAPKPENHPVVEPPAPPPPPPPPVAAAAAPAGGPEGNIQLRIQGSQVIAELVSPITLKIPGTMIQATVEGQVKPAAPATPATQTTPTTAPAPASPPPTPPPAQPAGSRSTPTPAGGGARPLTTAPTIPLQPGELQREILETEKGAVTKITQALRPGETTTRTFNPDETSKRTRLVTGTRSPEEQFDYEVREVLKAELAGVKSRARTLKTAATPEKLETLAADTRATAQRLQASFEQAANDLLAKAKTNSERRAAQTVIGPASSELNRRVFDLNSAAEQLELKTAEMRKRIALDQEREMNKVRQVGAKAAAQAEREAQRQAELERKRQDAVRSQQAVSLRATEAEAMIERSRAEGFKLVGGKPTVSKKTTEGKDREVETHRFRKEEGSTITERVIKVEREASPPMPPPRPGTPPAIPAPGPVTSASFEETARPAPITSRGVGTIEYVAAKGKALATYAAEAMVLYGALDEVRKALDSMIQTGFETARLSQVFRGIGGSARNLIDDVLELGAIEGKTAKEAEDSAVSWARLGLTRSEANEAVRVSLRAANIAQVDAASATEHLQTITLAYGLQIRDLATVVGSVNAVSQEYSVTQNQIFDALSRTASVAKQTGLPLEELTGILGVLISKTGQTGVVVGNTVKTLIASLARLDTQKYLRDQFHMEVTVGGGSDVKNMNEIIRDLISTYQGLNQMERNILLTRLVGAQQISRTSALFDAYTETQIASANAQLKLNSAEETSQRIRATLQSRLIGLRTELDRFFAAFDQTTGFTKGLADITSGFIDVLRVVQQLNDITSPEFLGKAFTVPEIKLPDIEGKRSKLMQTVLSAAGGIPDIIDGGGIPDIIDGVVASGKMGLIGAFSQAMEGLGISSSGAEKRLAAFNTSVQQSTGEIKANEIAINVYRMAMDSLLKGTDTEIDSRAKAISKLGTLDKPEQFSAELSVAVKEKDQNKIVSLFTGQIEAAKAKIKEQTAARLEGIAAYRNQVKVELDRLDNSVFSKTPASQRQLQDLRERLSGQDSESATALEEERDALRKADTDYAEVLAKDVRHLTFLETQKATLQSIADIYRIISKASPLDEHFANISTLSEQVTALRKNLSDIDSEINRQSASAAGGGKVESGTALPALRNNRDSTQQLLTETEAKLNQAVITGQNSLNQARFGIAQQIAQAQAGSLAFGETEVDRLRQKEAGLQTMIEKRRKAIENLDAGSMERQSALVMQAEQLSELTKTRLDLERARFNVIREEYEFNKKLLTSGPAELLQRIVAQRITKGAGRVSAGQFMALSPGLRENVLEQSSIDRGRKFLNEYQGPVESANRVLGPANAQARVYQQMEREGIVQTPSVAQILNAQLQTKSATVIGENIYIQGKNEDGSPADTPSKVSNHDVQSTNPKDTNQSAPSVVWDFLNTPLLKTLLPDQTYQWLTHRESGQKISEATGLPRTIADVGAGALNAGADFSERMTSPVNLASMALWPIKAARLIFSAQALMDLKNKYSKGKEAINSGDVQGGTEAIIGAIVDILAAKQGLKGSTSSPSKLGKTYENTLSRAKQLLGVNKAEVAQSGVRPLRESERSMVDAAKKNSAVPPKIEVPPVIQPKPPVIPQPQSSPTETISAYKMRILGFDVPIPIQVRKTVYGNQKPVEPVIRNPDGAQTVEPSRLIQPNSTSEPASFRAAKPKPKIPTAGEAEASGAYVPEGMRYKSTELDRRVEELSAQYMTAREIAASLKITPDEVRSIRDRRGVPSQELQADFDAWLEQWKQSKLKSRAAQELGSGLLPTAAVAAAAATVTASASTQETDPAQAPKTAAQRQEIDQIVQQFASKFNITVSEPKSTDSSRTLDTIDVSAANLALAQFTQTVNESGSAMSALTQTVNVLAESVGEVVSELDVMSERIGSLVPKPNYGPAKLNYAE